MWIEHLGPIMMGAFVVLIAAHFGLHVYFKYQKRRQSQKRANPSSDNSSSDNQPSDNPPQKQ